MEAAAFMNAGEEWDLYNDQLCEFDNWVLLLYLTITWSLV
jgi:hypothetical protein